MPHPPKIFISYSHKDRKWLEDLQTYLKPSVSEAQFDPWDDTRIVPGTHWQDEIRRAIDSADIGVLLVTPEFLASDFIAQHELPPLLAKPKVFWIAVKSCDHGVTGLAARQCANDPARPLDSLGVPRRGKEWVRLCQRLHDALGITADSSPTQERATLGEIGNVPHARNRTFTGRGAILADLESALKARKATVLTQAIAGLGGIGKTQTAVEYCYRHRDDYRFILWARADSEESLLASFSEIADVLNLPERTAADRDVICEAVKLWLARTPGYLLVLDNANEPRVLSQFLPLDPRGHLLITTRAEDLDLLNLDDVIALPEMHADEAVAFLFKRTRSHDEDPSERAAAERLAAELGYLPLALEQAAAYIAVNKTSFRDYLRDYQRLHLDLLEEQVPVTGDYPETVCKTWAKNIRAVRETSPEAAELLAVSAFFGPDRIPYELLVEGASELGEPLSALLAKAKEDARPLNRLLTLLSRYSLIRRDRKTRTYDIHLLVQAVIRAEMDEVTHWAYAERAVRAVNMAFPRLEFSNWLECDRLLSHALACAVWINAYGMEFAAATRLLNEAAYYLDDRAQYSAAEPLYRIALQTREDALGPEHPDTAASLNNLAYLYLQRGRYKEAEHLYCRALAIREKVLGPEHPHTAASLGSLAEFYRHQGQYAAAEPLYRRALVIHETASGPDHPNTATSLNNLANLYRSQGQYAMAEPLYRSALAIYELASGTEHTSTATSLNNLAMLYDSQGQYAAAEPLYRRALAIREKVLGLEHPDTARCRENYAALLDRTGHPAEAETLQQRAEEIRSAHDRRNATQSMESDPPAGYGPAQDDP